VSSHAAPAGAARRARLPASARGAGLDGALPEEIARRLLAWLELDDRPRILATAQGEVVWMNRAAAELPAGAFPFARAGAQQASGRRRLDPRLPRELSPAGPELRCATAGPEFADEAWMVWARSLPGPGGPLQALLLRPRREGPRLEVLGRARQLTRAEVRVVEMISEGVETAAIADALKISVETLRTHVKHVYRKLGVTSRGELFAVVSDYLQP
jgi:DNA-binding CsgD family transcriptional regulator